MGEQPKISIIIPVYNVEPYLRRCLDSVIGQTYQNLEIILVDDGSTDGSGTICDEYAAQDARIRVIHKENGGVSAARNDGLAAASGEWIGFVDADDCIEPDMYESLLSLAERYGADIAQCGIFFEDEEHVQELFRVEKERHLPYGAEGFSLEEWGLIGNAVWNKLYRGETVRNICFESAYPIGEDLLFNVNAMLGASGIVLGARSKYHYIQRQDSACHKPPTLAKLTSYRRAVTELLKRFETGTAAHKHFELEQLRNDMDICSKIVRFEQPEFETVRTEVRKELRDHTGTILTIKGLSLFERTKLWLIAWFWRLYKVLLLRSKKECKEF